MELDQLKILWKHADENLSSINHTGIEDMLRHRSKRPIARMKRNLILEIIFLIITYSWCFWFISDSYNKMYIYYDIVLGIAAFLFFIYARYKYKLLDKMECASCEVKSNLSARVAMLEKLVKLYFYSGNISAALGYIISVVIAYIELFTERGKEILMPGFIELSILLIIGIAFVLFAYFINRWYVFKLYGQHIQKLKNILYEMEEPSND